MAGLFGELKRRNVVRVGIAYIVVGWVAVQIAEVLFDAFGTPDWVIKTVIVLIALGFPFALLFAWAFELTPDGLKKTRDVDVSESITPRTGQKLNYIIIGALVVALGYFIWDRQAHDHSNEIPSEPVTEVTAEPGEEPEPATDEPVRRSIAVLPFVNMSSDEEQEYFADGLTEEILNSLANAPDLLVSARTSSFSFKGSDQPITEIAASLGVDHVLEGSVRRGGDTLRITAQLIRAEDGFHLWSETFDRTPDDVIAIQEEIAVQIATALETAMDPEALREMMSAGTTSVTAYEAYLTGIGAREAFRESGDVYELLLQREQFEKAIEIDPEFAQALNTLSVFWTLQLITSQVGSGITDLDREEIKSRRDDLKDRAIRHATDEVERTRYEAGKAMNQNDFRRAVRLQEEYFAARPNETRFRSGYLIALSILGRYEEVDAKIAEYYENFEFSRNLANEYLQRLRTPGSTELMRQIANRAIEKFSNDVAILYQAHRQLLWAGDIDGASRILPEIVSSRFPEETRHLANLRQLCAEQRVSEAQAVFDKIVEYDPDDVSVIWLAYQILGDSDAAVELLEPYDKAGDFDPLLDVVGYATFDATKFPNLLERFPSQRYEERELLALPYRCNR